MKKRILVFCIVLVTVSLTIAGFINFQDIDTGQLQPTLSKDSTLLSQLVSVDKKSVFTDFIYEVGPRFEPIKKGKVYAARSIEDFYDKEQMEKITSLTSVSVILIINDRQSDIREVGYTKEFTSAQLKLLQSSEYETSFIIRADYLEKNNEMGALSELVDSYTTPHHTVVPEKQAYYTDGKESLMKYLRENSKDAIATVDPNKLQPAKLYFTVTKNGTIENIHLDRTSGYPEVDKRMIDIIKKAPGIWEPAENAEGDKVNQELVVSFGLMGC